MLVVVVVVAVVDAVADVDASLISIRFSLSVVRRRFSQFEYRRLSTALQTVGAAAK